MSLLVLEIFHSLQREICEWHGFFVLIYTFVPAHFSPLTQGILPKIFSISPTSISSFFSLADRLLSPYSGNFFCKIFIPEGRNAKAR